MTSDRRRTDRRNRLVHAATDLFRRRGATAASVGAICEAVGVTKGVFSHHFPDGRAELTRAIIQQNAIAVDTILADQIERHDNVGDAIGAVFDFYADLLVSDPDFGCPIAASVVDLSAENQDVRALTAEAFARWEHQLTTVIAAADSDVDATGVARTTVAAFEGAILLARSHNDPSIMRDVGRTLARQITPQDDQ